jgi:hypothetical protein
MKHPLNDSCFHPVISIGATATVVSAGLLHDTIDDSFMDYDDIFQMLGAGVADLVEGVCVCLLHVDHYFGRSRSFPCSLVKILTRSS